MALMIIDGCMACDACEPVCPADCIVQNPDFLESRDELAAKYELLHA